MMKNCYAKFMEGRKGQCYSETMKQDEMLPFKENLVRLRYEAGLTQEELAELLGVSRTAVAKWEAGNGLPKLINLITLSRLFGVTLDELLLACAEPQEAAPQSPDRDGKEG